MASGSRRLAAIMFTDMVGYSALAQADEAAALGVLERHNRLLRPLFARFRGREVKTAGDSFLVEFDSALDAAQCALEIQQALHDYNLASGGEWRIRVRIGLHVGDVVEANGDVLGDAVNVAARIEPLAEPGGICLTQQVFDQIQNKFSAGLVRLPPTALKNIRVPVTLYRVAPPWEAVPPAGPPVGATPGRHLAVLPLANISPDPNDAYFADGLHEELISVLSRVRNLSVIARTSVILYKTQPKSVAQVGSELGVDTVLEGSVRKAGNRLRITLQLIDVATQRHIWANSYNREVDDVFQVQSDIAERTAEALNLELAQPRPAGGVRRPTANPAAYDHYLRGLVAAALPLRRFDEASRDFEEATRLDPEFAEAYASWANLCVAVSGDRMPMAEIMPRARTLAARALELDPSSSEAHAALANIFFQFDQDWSHAEEEFRRALALNPSNTTAHAFFGLMLTALGRLPEAEEEQRELIRLDPEGEHETMLAYDQLLEGRFEEALEVARRTRDRDPTPPRRIAVGWFALYAGRQAEALAAAEVSPEGLSYDQRYDLALLQAMVGRPELAQEVVREVQQGTAGGFVSKTELAMLWSALGERARALDLLEEDQRERNYMLWAYAPGAWFDAIRDDPRFVALLRDVGVPDLRRRLFPPPG